MVIAPHPDDEVIGCGGTILRHAGAGDPVTVVYLSRGEGGHGYPWLSPEERGRVREAEARRSCRILGVSQVVFLDCGDQRVESSGCDTQLAEIIANSRPKAIFAPHARDNHADHAAAHRLLLRALALAPQPLACCLWTYETWSPLHVDAAVDITRFMRQKVRALACHQCALDISDWIPAVKGLGAYRSVTCFDRRGYAEAFERVPWQDRFSEVDR